MMTTQATIDALTEKLAEGRAIRETLTRGHDNPPGEYERVRPRAVEWAASTVTALKAHALHHADDFWRNEDAGWGTWTEDGPENPWITVRPHLELLLDRLAGIIKALAREQ